MTDPLLPQLAEYIVIFSGGKTEGETSCVH